MNMVSERIMLKMRKSHEGVCLIKVYFIGIENCSEFGGKFGGHFIGIIFKADVCSLK